MRVYEYWRTIQEGIGIGLQKILEFLDKPTMYH